MPKKRPPTIEACKQRNNRVLRLDHVELIDEDIEWLAATERLTIWNVKVPAGLLARLEKLWWLDIRGGSATDLGVAQGVKKLQYLAVNQVRGMRNLALVSKMATLRRLDLYGLPKVTKMPNCAKLMRLERASIGQMGGLASLHGLLQAPNLRELKFSKKINVSQADVNEIIAHPTLKAFDWFAEDVPDKVWVPIVEKIGKPPMDAMHPEDWFGVPLFTDAE